MAHLRVLQPGLLTSIQDLGRLGHASLGVPESGALDLLALIAGNRLLSNADGTAAIEITLGAASFSADQDVVVTITGATMRAPFILTAGTTLNVPAPSTGCRSYLCARGGLDVPMLLGSRSTCLPGTFGGVEGRALKAGDEIVIQPSPRTIPPRTPRSEAFDWLRAQSSRRVIRVIGAARDLLNRGPFRVSTNSDRAGVRLIPSQDLRVSESHQGRMISEATPLGGVQLPPTGEPIILLNDRPVTGGYPLVDCVAGVDLPAVGQARPGDTLAFEEVALDDARALWRRQRDELDLYFPPAEPMHI